jgi:formyltetrahydrofolate-dependent phosphoribosylglycinamide formyltransferase
MDASGRKIVFTSGCFDILHAGHVRYLRQAHDLGDALVIAMNSDSSVRELKGPTRPINSQDDRAEVLAALACVDRVVVFDDKRTTRLIEAIRPHIYAKGGDYTIDSLDPGERAALESVGAQIEILSLVAGKSTTSTIERANAIPKLAILGSGEGSNFEAIAEAIESGNLHAEITTVISDHETAPILTKARERKIDALCLTTQEEIRDLLLKTGTNLVVLAGFMRILKAPILDAFAGRIVNTHPSLLPAFKGKQAWKQVLDAGETETGCTVHMVDKTLDGGPILAQTKVPIEPNDTPESLHARIKKAEHDLYPKTIQQLLTK